MKFKSVWIASLGLFAMSVLAAPHSSDAAYWNGHGSKKGGGGGGGGGGSVVLPKVEGTVIQVTANSVTIANVTVMVTAATKIERNDVSVPLSAIKVGDRGQALYDPTTKVASKVESVGP